MVRCFFRCTFIASLFLVSFAGQAQTQGPMSPGTITTVVGGTVSWVNANNAASSNNSYSTVTNGVSNFIKLSNFGFSIPAGSTINGITLEVERKAAPVSPVAANTWSQYNNANYSSGTATANYGSTTYSYNLPVSSATNNRRLLVVTLGIENVDNAGAANPAITMTSVTYNGVAMTLAAIDSRASANTSNYSATYYLKESGLPATTGARNLVITKSFSGEASGGSISPGEYVEIVGVNTFTNVDQTNSVTAVSQNAGASSIVSPNLNFLRNGDYLIAGTINNNPAAGGNIAAGALSTEAFERSYSNTASSSSGANYQVQYRFLSGVGVLSAPMSATGTGASRMVMTALSINASRAYDNSVMTTNASGALSGSNMAAPATLVNAWDDDDVIEVYGGASNLWGSTWTAADVNDPDFGISFQVNATNAVSSLDNVMITISYSEPLGFDFDPLFSEADAEDGAVTRLNLYPNPAAVSHFFIESEEAINEVGVYDCVGKQLPVSKITMSDTKVQLENTFTKGTYSVIVRTASGVSYQKLFVE
jgi:hypothetical protein